MSKREHTPGLLTARQAISPTDGAYDFAIAAEVDGRKQCIAEVFGRCSETTFLPAEANAARIVASWNACDGISTESLEDGVIVDAIFVVRQIINDLPSNKDWLDPRVERIARELLAKLDK